MLGNLNDITCRPIPNNVTAPNFHLISAPADTSFTIEYNESTGVTSESSEGVVVTTENANQYFSFVMHGQNLQSNQKMVITKFIAYKGVPADSDDESHEQICDVLNKTLSTSHINNITVSTSGCTVS